MKKAVIYLLPTVLNEGGFHALNEAVLLAIKQCDVFFVENERTTRRFLKKIWKEIVIDQYTWHVMDDSAASITFFRDHISSGKTIGILSEAGCPAIADPGSHLVAIAHEMHAEVKPITGPSSILLALMGSGLNGQHFRFTGYLPIKDPERTRAIRELENESLQRNCTQIFIETPYRNNQLIDSLISSCRPETRLCIAVDLTGETEWIKTMSMREWNNHKPDIHKRTAIFCLLA